MFRVEEVGGFNLYQGARIVLVVACMKNFLEFFTFGGKIVFGHKYVMIKWVAARFLNLVDETGHVSITRKCFKDEFSAYYIVGYFQGFHTHG